MEAIEQLERLLAQYEEDRRPIQQPRRQFLTSRQTERVAALRKASKSLADLNRRFPSKRCDTPTREENLMKAQMLVDVVELEISRLAQQTPKTNGFQKSHRERTLMENIAVSLGIDPDHEFVNRCNSVEQLQRLNRVRSLENVLSTALGAGGRGDEIFREIANAYDIPVDSSTFRRSDIAGGATSLRQTRLIELLESLRNETGRLDCDDWLDALIATAKSFKK